MVKNKSRDVFNLTYRYEQYFKLLNVLFEFYSYKTLSKSRLKLAMISTSKFFFKISSYLPIKEGIFFWKRASLKLLFLEKSWKLKDLSKAQITCSIKNKVFFAH
jgi:hypothetical protein